ncbi:MAG: hypothetical protein ACR2PS_14240 [Pseudomonadales bacterium]
MAIGGECGFIRHAIKLHIVIATFFRSFQHAEVHNEALPDESGAFRTDVKFPESDHAPVIAQLEI